jgi:methylenetetrahydrofolate dehydrogenase (NADP+)/methenyltetrahydrofolate cyclohydrolase
MLIDGKIVAQKIKDEVKGVVNSWQLAVGSGQIKNQPTLATILVGNDPASQVYVKNKIKACEYCGIKSIHQNLSEKISQGELLSLVQKFNNDNSINGILVQLPLPKHINSELVIQAIDPKKDVDGFHPYNLGMLLSGQQAFHEPCTPAGVMELLKHYQISLVGKDVLIVGRSNIVGKPLAVMMLRENATVTVAHSKTLNLPTRVKEADIVVAAIGRPSFIKGDWIKKGAVVVDVGINRQDDGTICGDVEFTVAKKKASFITPVPGGVGPMTIAMLMRSVISLLCFRESAS